MGVGKGKEKGTDDVNTVLKYQALKLKKKLKLNKNQNSQTNAEFEKCSGQYISYSLQFNALCDFLLDMIF